LTLCGSMDFVHDLKHINDGHRLVHDKLKKYPLVQNNTGSIKEKAQYASI